MGTLDGRLWRERRLDPVHVLHLIYGLSREDMTVFSGYSKLIVSTDVEASGGDDSP